MTKICSRNKKYFSSFFSSTKKTSCHKILSYKTKNLGCCFLATFCFCNGMISLAVMLIYQTSMDSGNKLGINLTICCFVIKYQSHI